MMPPAKKTNQSKTKTILLYGTKQIGNPNAMIRNIIKTHVGRAFFDVKPPIACPRKPLQTAPKIGPVMQMVAKMTTTSLYGTLLISTR